MKDKIKEFFSKNGYAAAIYSCVALVVVLAAGVAVFDSLSGKSDGEVAYEEGSFEEAVNNSKDKSYTEETTEKMTKSLSAETPTEAATDKTAEAATQKAENKQAEKPTEAGTKTASADNLFAFDENTQEMLIPTEGKIVMDYSPEIAVFDPTLEQYRTNETICIAGDEGTPVSASADGVVYDAGFDETKGNFVVLDHGNGWMSTYSQLGENLSVAVGDIVNAGEVIAYIGEPSAFQSALGSHLEFYLTHNDEPTDPKLLFESEE